VGQALKRLEAMQKDARLANLHIEDYEMELQNEEHVGKYGIVKYDKKRLMVMEENVIVAGKNSLNF
jgi:hypothetical protein